MLLAIRDGSVQLISKPPVRATAAGEADRTLRKIRALAVGHCCVSDTIGGWLEIDGKLELIKDITSRRQACVA